MGDETSKNQTVSFQGRKDDWVVLDLKIFLSSGRLIYFVHRSAVSESFDVTMFEIACRTNRAATKSEIFKSNEFSLF